MAVVAFVAKSDLFAPVRLFGSPIVQHGAPTPAVMAPPVVRKLYHDSCNNALVDVVVELGSAIVREGCTTGALALFKPTHGVQVEETAGADVSIGRWVATALPELWRVGATYDHGW